MNTPYRLFVQSVLVRLLLSLYKYDLPELFPSRRTDPASQPTFPEQDILQHSALPRSSLLRDSIDVYSLSSVRNVSICILDHLSIDFSSFAMPAAAPATFLLSPRCTARDVFRPTDAQIKGGRQECEFKDTELASFPLDWDVDPGGELAELTRHVFSTEATRLRRKNDWSLDLNPNLDGAWNSFDADDKEIEGFLSTRQTQPPSFPQDQDEESQVDDRGGDD